MKEVIIVGGGASGLLLSVLLSEKGISVRILEKEERTGKKLVRTGNGKCNFTNRDLSLKHFHGDFNLIENVIGSFNLEETLNIFERLGIENAEGEEGRIYPRSFQAHALLDALRFYAEERGCIIECGKEVYEIENPKGRFTVKCKDGSKYMSDILVISAGGKAGLIKHSETMYKIAEKMGHRVNETFPSLVQLTLKGKVHSAAAGMRWKCGVRLYENGENSVHSSGDVLFTDYGVSGDAILDISRKAVEASAKGERTEIGIDLLDDRTIKETSELLKRRIKEFPERKVEHLFTGIMNKKVGRTMLQSIGIDLNERMRSLEGREEEISKIVHDWRFEVKGHSGWANAQVTAGGIDAGSIDKKSLESKIVKNLYFTGEFIDVDGDCGGYNLQWAWSSAYTVFKSIEKLTKE